LLPVGLDLHALDMSAVREVVSAPLVTALPTAPRTVLGVFNLRGEIVPLFDTAALLGFGTTPAGNFAAVVQTPAGPAGLVATGFPESVELGRPTGATESEGTIAAYAVGTRIATLLDLEFLLSPARIGGWVS
jgi:purine-binding chemotaxis protein CheW